MTHYTWPIVIKELHFTCSYKPAVLLSVYAEIKKSLKCSPDKITTHTVTIPASSSTLIEVVLNPTRIISVGTFGRSNDNEITLDSSLTDMTAHKSICPVLEFLQALIAHTYHTLQ